MKKILLLSGGLDSKILLAWMVKKYGNENIVGVTIEHPGMNETAWAKKSADEYNITHVIMKCASPFHSSFSPFRNLFYLSYAINKAVDYEADEVYYATHYPAEHYQGLYYPDCSPDFVSKLDEIIIDNGVTVVAPFIYKTLEEEIKIGRELSVNFRDVKFCNNNPNINCGHCEKCIDVWKALSGNHENVIPSVIDYDKPLPLINNESRKNLMAKYMWLKEFRLYINNSCNRNCYFCYYNFKTGEGGERLDIFDWFRVIDKGKELGIKQIMISGKEPLITDDYVPIVRYANSKGIFSEINTNGDFLEREIETLIDLAQHHGLKKVLCSDVDNKYLKELNRYVEVQPYLVVDQNNKGKVCDIVKMLYDKGIRNFYIRFMKATRDCDKELEVPIDEHESIYVDLWLLKLKNVTYETPVETLLYPKHFYQDYNNRGYAIIELNDTSKHIFRLHTFCERYWRSLTIMHDGTITGCAKDTYYPLETIKANSIGNIKNMSASQILDACKRKIENNKYGLCKFMGE